MARLVPFAAEQGMRLAKVVAEVGSGLNGRPKGFLGVLCSLEYGAIVVEHRDRPARFGPEHIEAALAASGRRRIVIEPDEVTDDLVVHISDVLTSLCAWLYGRRSARRPAEKAVKAAIER